MEERVVFEARLFYIINPWLAKLPSETLHLKTEPQMASGMGFSAVRNLDVVPVEVYFVVVKGMSCPLKTF